MNLLQKVAKRKLFKLGLKLTVVSLALREFKTMALKKSASQAIIRERLGGNFPFGQEGIIK